MVKFDWSNFRLFSKEDYAKEVKNSVSIQDEVKVFNERFPEHLKPLYKLQEEVEEAQNQGVTVGEFGESGFSGDTNQELIWSFFLAKGFHKKAIAGIMGNIGQETGGSYDPKTIQGGGAGPGTGLIQWGNNADGDRWSLLVKWAKSKNKDEWATETQMEYLWIEMQQQYHLNLMSGYLKKYGYNPGNDTLKAFSQVDNIEHAMLIFELTIERAGDKHYPRRLKYGEEAYAKFKDWDPSQSVQLKSNSGLVIPYKRDYVVTSEYGYRNISNGSSNHKGIDLSTGTHTPIYPAGNGTVVLNDFGNGPGYNVVIDHGVINNKQIFTRYMHLQSKSTLKVGQVVDINTQIGREGGTGGNYAVHLHLEIQEQKPGTSYSYGNHVNPRNHLNFTGKGRA